MAGSRISCDQNISSFPIQVCLSSLIPPTPPPPPSSTSISLYLSISRQLNLLMESRQHRGMNRYTSDTVEEIMLMPNEISAYTTRQTRPKRRNR
ncbi:uncharacterized protein J3R85_002684 [Psidium guajava]|nr:uncharacterized protein J3R85_002684 [Psidium guajava]